jgi:hypothetical protein
VNVRDISTGTSTGVVGNLSGSSFSYVSGIVLDGNYGCLATAVSHAEAELRNGNGIGLSTSGVRLNFDPATW